MEAASVMMRCMQHQYCIWLHSGGPRALSRLPDLQMPSCEASSVTYGNQHSSRSDQVTFLPATPASTAFVCCSCHVSSTSAH